MLNEVKHPYPGRCPHSPAVGKMLSLSLLLLLLLSLSLLLSLLLLLLLLLLRCHAELLAKCSRSCSYVVMLNEVKHPYPGGYPRVGVIPTLGLL